MVSIFASMYKYLYEFDNYLNNGMVLINYLHTDFQSVEKPKGGPLEIEIFFVEGGLRKELEGGGSGAF